MSARSQTGSKLKTTVYLLMVPTVLVLAVNLFWLNYSTTRVSIPGRGVASVKIHLDHETIDLGNLRSGESRFMFLPKVGSALYSITFRHDDYEQSACEVEVEETGQHVEVSLLQTGESVCKVTEPMLSSLMVTKFF